MNPDDVVISGVGGLFPKAANLEEFKQKLFSNESLLGSRWKEGERGVSNKLGVCENIDKFDAAFFGIHRNQATYMDPMQRLVLENTFDALTDAGVNPNELRGRKVGVFAASSVGENDNLFYESIVSGFGVTGHSRAMMANRISYWLNLKGPSCAYDSNWIGGIEVLSLAFDAIRHGRCESAIIASANLALNSELSWLYNDMGLLSPDGSTRAFDANACGYARADGIVVMYLQRASDAYRAYATVVHASTIYDGARDGPVLDLNLNGMTQFLEKFYSDCDVDPADVEYVEAYGCGIKKTDEIEMKAIEKIYCQKREKPLLIGALKPQTGHSEASDSLMTIAKVLIAFEAKEIPATLQHTTPNPNIPGLFNGNLEVVTKNRPWAGNLAAVHGIGITSSYAHLLLRGNSKSKQISEEDASPKLLLASTRTEGGIQQILQTLQNDPNIDRDYIGLTHKLFSKSISGHLYRGYAILDKNDMPKQEFEHFPGNKRPIWFIYSGMGSQWVGMGVELMKLPIFAKSIMKTHEILKPKGIDLLHIITANDPKMFDSILHSFVGIAAIQIALTDILRALGVVPDGIIGHSVGELGCAYADDCLTAEQMIMCSYSRGKASLEVELIKGMMAAIGMGYNQVKDGLPPSIEVACHNSKDNCTLSGPTEDLEVYVKQLQEQGVFARLVNVSNIAYHSKYIKPAAPRLLEYLRRIIPHPKTRSSKWISTSAPEDKWNTEDAKLCSAMYHTNNLLGSVLFEEGTKHIPDDAIAIEIAPHGLLQAILKRSLKSGCTNIALTQRGNKNPLQFLLSAVGKMYLAGIDVDVAALYPPIEFPVSRGTATLAPLVHWEHSERWRIGIEDKMQYLVSVKDVNVMLNSEEFRYCTGHELDDNYIFPFSGYLEIIMEIISYGLQNPLTEIVFENIEVKNILSVPKVGSVFIHAMVQKGSGGFEVLSGETLLITGRAYIPEATDKPRVNAMEIDMGETSVLTGKDVYSEFNHRGHKYTADFKSIKSITMGKEGQTSTLTWQSKWQMLLESLFQQAFFKEGEKHQNVLIPSYILKIVMNMDKMPTTTGEDIDVAYNYYTNVITCDSMQVVGLKTNSMAEMSKPINLHDIDFVPFYGSNLKNLDTLINHSIHLVLSNFDEVDTKNLIITEIETPHASFAENVKNVLQGNIDINANFHQTKESKVAIISTKSPVLIICNDRPSDHILKVIASTHAFGLVKLSGVTPLDKHLVEVANFRLDGQSYSLIKRASNTTRPVVQIKSDVVSVKDLTKDGLPWVQELKSKVAMQKATVLVCSCVPTEGIANFTLMLRSNLEFKSVRCFFALDKKVDISTLLNDVLQRDLYVSVLKNGSCGSYIPISIDFVHNLQRQTPIANTLISTKHLQYIGINVDDETLTKEKHDVGLGNIDYVGVNKNGEVVIGLAKMDKDTCDLIPDPVLHWKIPDNWSNDDGCSVPHAYATAYYILVMRGKVEPGDTVLIHNGCSAIGLALINVALSYGCTIFTTVANEEQKVFLRKRFDMIVERNILSNQNSSFELNLLFATGGQGAHIIVNTLSKSLLSCGVRCLANKGRFIQLGKHDVKEHYSIGMSVFLKNTSVETVVPENIFDLPNEKKEMLRNLVQHGIESFHVRPIISKISEDESLKSIIEQLVHKDNIGKILVKVTPEMGINYLNMQKPNQFICESRASYIVYGGTTDIWMDMVEWLVFRGARKVVVNSDFKPQQPHLNRRLELLRRYFNAQIHYIPNKIQTKENASEFLSDIYKIGPISAIFVLPLKTTQMKQSDIKPIQYIDMALRNIAPKTLFVNLCSSAFGVGQVRADGEFPTYNVEWPDSVEFSDVLYGLDEVLALKTKHMIIKSSKVSDIIQETTQALYKKLTLMLPVSAQDLLEQYKSAPEKSGFKQILTLGPRRIREVPPVFVIPGLFNCNIIHDLCFNLYHPTFVAQLPSNNVPLEQVASELSEEILSIFPNGPFNIVGVSWGGPLSIEVAKILQQKGSVRLTILDGTPDTIKLTISNLGESVNLEVNVLSNLLNVISTETLKSMTNAPNISSRIDIALGQYQGDKEDDKDLKEALDLLLHRLKYFIADKSSDELLEGEVFLIRPTGSSKYDDCGLTKYASQKVQIRVVNGDHLSMLDTKEISEIINENIMIRNKLTY